MKTQTTYELEFEGDHFLEVTVDIDYSLENDGIGSYEFWGEKGNDIQMCYIADDFKILDAKNNDITSKLDVAHYKLIEAFVDEHLDNEYGGLN